MHMIDHTGLLTVSGPSGKTSQQGFFYQRALQGPIALYELLM